MKRSPRRLPRDLPSRPADREEFFSNEIEGILDLLESTKGLLGDSKEASLIAETAACTTASWVMGENWPHDPARSTVNLAWSVVSGELLFTLRRQDLEELLRQSARQGHDRAVRRMKELLNWYLDQIREAASVLEQRRDNGESLAEEGRAARKSDDDARADRVCNLYRKIRDGHPPGRRGNGAAVAEVARQIGPLFDRDKPITTTAVRKILKRRGVPCR